MHSDQRQIRLSSAWPLLEDELAVVGAVEGAGVVPLDVELAEPDDDDETAACVVPCVAPCAAAALPLVSCVEDMAQEGYVSLGTGT